MTMRSSKSYRPWTPTQSYLLPPSPLEWLPKDHLAYFVLDLVSQLDLSAIEALDQARTLDPRDDDDDEPPQAPTDMPSNSVPTDRHGKPKPTAQRNFVDPDSRIMMQHGEFAQAYNAQVVVDADHQIILAHGVGNQAPDAEYLIPMVERLVANDAVGDSTTLLADAGYMCEANVRHAEQRGIDALIAVRRDRHGSRQSASRPAWAGMRDKLTTPHARAAYARRKVIVEPAFGQMKEARRFRRFSLRGLAKSGFEWAFVCLAHNALKLFRAFAKPPNPEPGGLHALPATSNAVIGVAVA
jgi:hypothetical protein